MRTATTTKSVVTEGMRTPWGKADRAWVVASGIGWTTTPGHGGVKLSRAVNARMPDYMRLKGGWYEEDCEWAMVYVALADYLKVWAEQTDLLIEESDTTRRVDDIVAEAKNTLRSYYPDAYERFFGETIPEGESYAKDRRTFKARHADDWVSISVECKNAPDGFVEVLATKGGEERTSAARPDTKTFLVPEAEYDERPRFGFVVDPAKHEELSSLPTWTFLDSTTTKRNK